jgi:hypothetical protein
MNTIQFLAVEIGAECNLAALHTKCPSALRARTGTPLTDGQILALVVEAYEEHNFKGLTGWHYYNEPTLQLERILGLMQRIRAAVPAARFILWSNGTIPCDDARMGLFESAQISNYTGNEELLRERFPAIKKVNVFTPRFDDRLAAPVGAATRQRCLRPFVEIPVDNFGTVHLCCQDWQGEIELGNVHRDSWETILARRLEVIEKISGREMTADAPRRCLGCSGRALSLPGFDAAARDAAYSWLAELERPAAVH